MEKIEEYLEKRILPYKMQRKEKGEEDKKTMEEVFERRTLMAFYKLFKRGVIKYVEFPISTGKEAVVFRAVTPRDKFVAVKVYRMTTHYYKSFMKYLQGDPRFDHWYRASKHIIYVWAQKEFKNLEKFVEIGVRVPKPIAVWRNIVVMSYVGTKNSPAPLLKDADKYDAEKVYQEIIDFIAKAHKANFVHADLSEYNILIHRRKSYIIDCAQAVPSEHPLYMEFLSRDIKQIVRFFNKIGLGSYKDLLQSAIKKVMGNDVPPHT